MESERQIMVEGLNFASLANDINCYENKSFLSQETRQKAAYFFAEDQVRTKIHLFTLALET